MSSLTDEVQDAVWAEEARDCSYEFVNLLFKTINYFYIKGVIILGVNLFHSLSAEEKPFKCDICQQPLPSKWTLRMHMRKFHETTPSGPRPSRPRFLAGQPCPCTVCGKVFALPSQLKNHMTQHTGEKSFNCSTCGNKFRTLALLKHHELSHGRYKKNGLGRFKCRVCGKESVRFNEFAGHWRKAHKHIPFDSETAKLFGCGICGKPYYLRELAVVCALLGHNPERLHKAMFKYKCPECPDLFGFHHRSVFKKHWAAKHAEKELPPKYRANLYADAVMGEPPLPKHSIDKKKAEEIRENGPPKIKYEFPLFVEFDLLPVDFKVYKDSPNAKSPCTICGKLFVTTYLAKHVQKHSPDLKVGSRFACVICELTFSSRHNRRRHLKSVHKGNTSKID